MITVSRSRLGGQVRVTSLTTPSPPARISTWYPLFHWQAWGAGDRGDCLI